MTTLHITIDETVAAAVKKKAQTAGKSPEEWVSELVAKQAAMENQHWVDQFLEIADRAGGDSRGQKWTREELHER